MYIYYIYEDTLIKSYTFHILFIYFSHTILIVTFRIHFMHIHSISYTFRMHKLISHTYMSNSMQNSHSQLKIIAICEA